MSLLMTQDVCRCIGRDIGEFPYVVRAYEPGRLFQDVRISYLENGLVALDFHSPARRVVFSADALRKLADHANMQASVGGEPIKPIAEAA